MHAESAPSSPAPADPAGPQAPLDPGAFKPIPERDPRFAFRLAVAAGVLVIALAGFGVYVYRTLYYVDLSPAWSTPPTADRKGAAPGPLNEEASTPALEAAATRPSSRQAIADAPQSEGAPATADPPQAAAPPSAMSRPPAQRTAPREPKPAPDAVATRVGPKPAAVSAASCTEALAAMGLCTPGPVPRAQVPADVAGDPAACSKGVAALGLCSPSADQ